MEFSQISSGFTGMTQLQALQSMEDNSGVTGSTGGFFNDFIQSLLGSFDGTNVEAANLIAGLGVFSEEEPEDNEELMEMIASMLAMGVNYNDIMGSGSFDPTSYINSALSGVSNFDATTYADLQTISTNTGTDISALTEMATRHDYDDGALLLELAMSSADTNALSGFGSTSEFDLLSYVDNSSFSNNSNDLVSQLYSANTNMSTAIAQALASTEDSTVASVSEEPEEPTILEDISSFPRYIPTETSTTSVESTEEVFATQELDLDDLNEQIETGIKNGDITDTKEMVIKLRPEGLGEVTVKLVKDNESNIKIDIVTASETTARLLNDKLPQLRDSMRELQADISDVLYQDNEGNAEQNAKDQAAQWAYNQEQRNQRQAIALDDLDDLLGNSIDDEISEISEIGSSKVYI